MQSISQRLDPFKITKLLCLVMMISVTFFFSCVSTKAPPAAISVTFLMMESQH